VARRLDSFDSALFAELAQGLVLGRPLTLTEHTGSTNDDALAAARAGAPHGALFVTEEQARGRGRRGNAWLAPARQGLLFSVVLRPNVTPERAPALALLAGLAVREALAQAIAAQAGVGIAMEPRVKWPNDVVVGDKKIAGILVESQVRGSHLAAVVVGVGLNVGLVDLPSDVAKAATSLALIGVNARREALLAASLKAVETRLASLQSPETPLKELVSELNAQDALRGRKLSVGDVTGVGGGIDERGCLRIVDDAATVHAVHTVTAGHVSFWD
jgi:BirA family biotin operon repressor/biotin-[acetyl-CoA-carboxylase] ligase